ncbi:MAG TPA: hypothetical protein VKU82_04565 [Planctomycetaceae bacterium]|nr:hypothetical protein [Planctomycetaceae bacterium]
MSLNFSPVPFDLAAGFTHWLVIMVAVLALSFVLAIVISMLTLGFAGPVEVVVHSAGAFSDFLGTSPRRCLALTTLTFREAVRRKTLWVFAVFAVLFLFAGWFMSEATPDPDLQVKNYVSFVLRTINWLILPVVLLLACWGIPDDIKVRSLHTVVTKPVRRHEVVLGRIFGFAAIGGLVLVIMSAIGYVWINRQLPQAKGAQLIARVPVYGEINFLDNEGKPTKEGINVGDEVMFRSFIEGNTKARAIWNFSNLDPSRFEGQGRLVLESSFQSFRSHKGNIERQLMCQFTLINPKTKLRVPLKAFEVHEFRRNVYDVLAQNKTLQDEDGNSVELLKDIIQDGKLQVETACLSSAQYLGMAKPDLFVRLPDRSFAASYFKSITTIGLMMTMVVVLGVVSGCFVKGPVATMLTAFVVVVGKVAHSFLQSLVTGNVSYNPNVKMQGSGLFDSIYRIPTHLNPMVEIDNKLVGRVVSTLDNIELNALWAVQHMFPDFASFDTTEYVANGFDVPWAEALLPSLAITVGYCLPWILVGYFSLRLRELEAK